MGGDAHKCDRGIATQVHPEKSHEREEMADVHRRSGGIYAHIGSNGLLREQPVELLPASVISLECASRWRGQHAPSNVLDEAPLFQDLQHALIQPVPDPVCALLPL